MMTDTFKLKALTVAVLTSLVSSVACAAETDDSANNDGNNDIEVIEVTGFKSSLRKAMNAKRFADTVTDSIHAEDVGKSTDQNIADALSRVTGVTVQESDGEGTRIAVRGAGANLNQITMNGVALTSGLNGDSSDQSVDLSSFSSDVLSSIDVMKTAAAEQDEGSIGASVVLRTVKPLSLKKPRRMFEVQSRYNEYSGDFDGKVSGSFSNKFFDDTFGVVFTASSETQKTRKDSFKGSWYSEAMDISPIVNDAGELTPRAKDLNGNPIYEDMQVLFMQNASQVLSLNERNRNTYSAGFQWLPTDTTEVQLDLSRTTQDVSEDIHTYSQQLGKGTNLLNNVSDPQDDWYVVDTENHTLVSRKDRLGRATIKRELGGYDLNTNVATLTLKQQITDDLVMDVLAGYSRTTSETKDNYSVSLTADGKNEMPGVPVDELEPGGYDCQGGHCDLVVAAGNSSHQFDADGNSVNTQPIGLTNPLDAYLYSVGSLKEKNNYSDDTNKSLFVDFDWAVDFAGVTEVEFGAKYSSRIKSASTNVYTLTGNSADATDATEVNGLTDIKLVDILTGEAFPVDNFMDGLVNDSNQAYLGGWGVVDPKAAYLAYSGSTNALVKEKPGGQREIDQEVNAFYGQLNFEYFDGRLTGNVGLRYAKTTTRSDGDSVIKLQGGMSTVPADLIYRMQALNPGQFTNGTSMAQSCAEPVWQTDPVTGKVDKFLYPFADTGQVDANGDPIYDEDYYSDRTSAMGCYAWQMAYAYDDEKGGWGPNLDDDGELIVDSNGQVEISENDPNRILRVDYSGSSPVITQNDRDPITNTKLGRGGSENVINALRDRSTSGKLAEHQTLVNGNGDIDPTVAYERVFRSPGKSTNSVWLPSLNLNYAVSESLISRFSLSKTMARPTFDSLVNRSNASENLTSGQGSATWGDVNLVPLESRNADVSFEWYFNDSGMLSLAFFYKDMSNFEEKLNEVNYIRDIRTDYYLESIADRSDLFITPDDEMTPATLVSGSALTTDGFNATNYCLPERISSTDIHASLATGCREFNVAKVRNGKGAKIKGVEFSYTQNYDFLPGVLSGLGLNFNYTFADSESEEEILESTGELVTPLPQDHTPKHSANTTLFWEKDGLMLRLAHRYNSTQLISRGGVGGATWLDASSRLDFSSSYDLTKQLSISLQALNLLDETTRQFYTSTKTDVGDGVLDSWDEGNAMEGDTYTGRTSSEFKTGRLVRLSLRASF